MKHRRVTFPHMGHIHIALKAMLESIGLEVIVPPPITKRTLSRGIQYSPEFACLPLKINLGNFLEAFDLGANTIVMAGGWGPCRFGYYAQVQREILRDLGCNFELIVLEAPDTKFSAILGQVKELAGNCSWRQIGYAVRLGWEKVKALDALEIRVQQLRPREIRGGQVEAMYREVLNDIDRAANIKQIRAALQEGYSRFQKLILDMEKPVVRIGLVGEIYTVLEPFTNLHIERHLGRLGAEVTRSIYLSQWVNDHLFAGLLRIPSTKTYWNLSVPYINYWVGGHGRETVGGAVYFAQQGYDGVIQIGPLTCMPEIVAQSILPQVSLEQGIPVLTLYFDEHSGEAGLLTRLEAFVDLVRRRKKREKKARPKSQPVPIW
mgnify:CR=1 FL=1